MSYDEIIDIVSEQDMVLRQEKRNVAYANKLNFRVINGIIYNDKKQFWIPRRHANKKLFPRALDASVGGHVLAGESYNAAFERETQEELGLNVKTITYTPLARLTPREHNTSAFMWVYGIQSNMVPPYNTDDFIEYYWLSYEEFLTRLRNGDTAKSDLLPILTAIQELI